MADESAQTPKPKGSQFAFIISVLALLVSTFGLWMSHDTAKLQHAQAKPVPAILNASFVPEVGNRPLADPRQRVLILVMTVEHLGVRIKEVTVQPELLALPDESARKDCFQDLNKKTFTDSNSAFEVNPGKPSIASVIVTFPQSCSGGDWTFVGEATFKGQDDSGQKYEQPALFRAKAPTTLP